MTAAKRKHFFLLVLAALLFCAAPSASSAHVLHSKTRAELKTNSAPKCIELLAASLETASRYYDRFAETASDSPVAPKGVADDIAEGSFSVRNWDGYPEGVPKPAGPLRLLEGAEYDAARKAADKANRAIRRADPAGLKGKEIHETQPVKFGGSPTDPANKIALPEDVHRQQMTPWWNRLMRSITGG